MSDESVPIIPKRVFATFSGAGYVAALEAERDSLREQLAAAIAERDSANAKAQLYSDGITWMTECLNCARLMNDNYAQYVRIETLEAERAQECPACDDGWVDSAEHACELGENGGWGPERGVWGAGGEPDA